MLTFGFPGAVSSPTITDEQQQWLINNAFRLTNTLSSHDFAGLEVPLNKATLPPVYERRYGERVKAWLEHMGTSEDLSTATVGPFRDVFVGANIFSQ